MFDFIVSRNGENETIAKLDSDGVVYIAYLLASETRSESNTYIVHPNKGGLIRRDFTPYFAKLFNWAAFCTIYQGAK